MSQVAFSLEVIEPNQHGEWPELCRQYYAMRYQVFSKYEGSNELQIECDQVYDPVATYILAVTPQRQVLAGVRFFPGTTLPQEWVTANRPAEISRMVIPRNITDHALRSQLLFLLLQGAITVAFSEEEEDRVRHDALYCDCVPQFYAQLDAMFGQALEHPGQPHLVSKPSGEQVLLTPVCLRPEAVDALLATLLRHCQDRRARMRRVRQVEAAVE